MVDVLIRRKSVWQNSRHWGAWWNQLAECEEEVETSFEWMNEWMNEHLFQAAWPITQTNRHTNTQTDSFNGSLLSFACLFDWLIEIPRVQRLVIPWSWQRNRNVFTYLITEATFYFISLMWRISCVLHSRPRLPLTRQSHRLSITWVVFRDISHP